MNIEPKILFKFASLNANSIIKTNNNLKQQKYIKYLRTLQHHIICLQESNVMNNSQIDDLKILFQCQQAHWTEH